MRSHKFLVGLVVAAFTAGGAFVLTAEAAETLDCTAVGEFTLDPGIGTSGSSGVVDTHGETATLDCGELKGSLGFLGGYGTTDPDNCTDGGEGTGVFSYTLGDRHETSYVTYTFAGISGGLVMYSVTGDEFSGGGQVTPLEGDCATAPITKARAEAKYSITLSD